MNAESVTLESDERGFELHFIVDSDFRVMDDGHMVVNIQACDLDAFYDQVKARIGPYLAEMHEAELEVRRATGTAEGSAVAFLCDPDESAGAYDLSDPKHPEFHSTHADIWDARDGK